MKDPTTPTQWQEAADTAYLWLTIDSARQYGLTTGGPTINAYRCQQILDAAWKHGITPRTKEIDAAISETGQ